MTTREVTQHPNLKALGTTLILLGGPAAAMGSGFWWRPMRQSSSGSFLVSCSLLASSFYSNY